jgi:hypothetical protein
MHCLLIPSIAALVLMTASSSFAQDDHVSFYLTSTTVHVSNADRGSANDIQLTLPHDPEQYASFWTSGVGGGVTAHVIGIGPASIGLDLRVNNSGGNQSQGSLLGGVQLAYTRRPFGLRPYVQYSYGIFGTSAIAADPYVASSTCFLCSPIYTLQSSTRSGSYRGYEVFAGVDYRLARYVDLRAVELGIGTGHGSSNFDGTPLTNPTFFNIDTGLVLHF